MFFVEFDPVSNGGVWQDTIEITSADDGSLPDLSLFTFTIFVRRPGEHGPILTGGTADGIVTNPAPGILQWRFPSIRMLRAGDYEVGMKVSDGMDQADFVFGRLPILNGF